MRTFSETSGGKLEVREPNSGGDFLKAEQVIDFPLIAWNATTGTGEWGERAYLSFYIVDDDEHISYTVGFGEKSEAFRQLHETITQEKKTHDQFPFSCSVQEWGKSYQLAPAPEVDAKRMKQILAAVRVYAAENEQARQRRQEADKANSASAF